MCYLSIRTPVTYLSSLYIRPPWQGGQISAPSLPRRGLGEVRPKRGKG